MSPPTLDPSPVLAAYQQQVDLLMALKPDEVAAVDPSVFGPIWVPVSTVSKVVDHVQ